MTLLSPWAAALATAIGLPLLVLLYMLKLRRKPLRISSTILWEQSVRDLHANEPFRRFRLTLLFLLQLLALACLAIALGRPVLDAPAVLRDRVVIIIDASASMNALDVPIAPTSSTSSGTIPGSRSLQTRLASAKAHAQRIIDQIERSSTASGFFTSLLDPQAAARPAAMVIAAAHKPRVLAPLTSDIRALRDAVDAIEPTDQPLDLIGLDELLRSVVSIADAPSDDSKPASPARASSIILISDGGLAREHLDQLKPIPQSSWSFVHAGPPPPPRLQPDADDPAPARSERQSAPLNPLHNVGVVAFSARRQPADTRLVRVFARLVNNARDPRDVLLTCRINNQTPLGQTISLPPADLHADGSTTPGQAVASFDLEHDGAGVVMLSIENPDALPADNRAYAVLEPVRSPRVLLVVPANPAASSPLHPDPFLLSALDACEIRNIRVMDESIFNANTSLSDADDADAPPLSLGGAAPDVVIFDRVTPAALPPVSTLSFAGSLPGLVTLTQPREPAPQPATDPSRPSPILRTRFVAWDRSHPAMRDIALEAIVAAPALDLKSITQDQTIRLPDSRTASAQPIALGVAAATSASARELISAVTIRAAAGVPATRHLVVAFALDRSNWGPSESFPIFVSNALEYLTGFAAAMPARFATTDQSLVLSLPARLTTARLEGPVTRSFSLPPDRAAAEPVDLGFIERAGLYRIDAPPSSAPASSDPDDSAASSRPPIAWAAVNLLDADESLLRSDPSPALPASANAASSSESPADAPPSGPARGAVSDSLPSRSYRDIWHYLVILAAALLVVEWLVYAWQSRA